RPEGFTLLEVLIAMTVLSLGLLGLAGLQYASLQYNHSAHLRSQATVLAYDIIDRMRASRAAALQGGAYHGNGAFVDVECDDAFAPAGNRNMARQDIMAWRNDLACLLPGGQGSVALTRRAVIVRVRWIDARDEEGDDRVVGFRLVSAL